jgi:hypothetical protein
MMSFSCFFSARLRNYRRALDEAHGVRLMALHGRGDTNGDAAPGVYDPQIDNDLSYEDAILGLEIRNFMLSEYGFAQPPYGVFQRVMRAIEESLAPSRRASSEPWAVRFFRVLNGGVAGRLLPGAVALAIVFMVFGSNSGRLLGSNTLRSYPLADLQAVPTQAPQADIATVSVPDGKDLTIAGLQLPIKNETEFYDRVEMRLPALRHQAKDQLQDSQPEFLQYDRNRSGAQ